jgi:hypothetical protein
LDFGLGDTDAGLFKIFVCGAAFGLGKTEKIERKMNEQEFKKRTKQLALRVMELVDELPTRRTVDVLGRQLD